MDILEKASKMLWKHPLCNNCLGRQFALLGHDMQNDERGKAIKTLLTLKAHALMHSKKKEAMRTLRNLATNGCFEAAKAILPKTTKHILRKEIPKTCFLCEDSFRLVDELAAKAIGKLKEYEYHSFLVGIKLPVTVEEREDEFKAEFKVCHSENMRNEFGRIIGKKIAEHNGKTVEHKKPEVVALVNPLTGQVKLQINPLYITGNYRKLIRGIPQSKWLCPNCRGEGCGNCDWTGKMYQESVEEITGTPFIDATGGTETAFHASGREDIDARMLGKGRPFVTEIKEPRKRFLDLKKLEETINSYAEGKVEVSNLRFADKDIVRKLKRGESSQKEYRVIIEFEKEITAEDMRLLEKKLIKKAIKQKTPTRVLHRRADLTREKYIYEVKVKKLSPKKAKMKIRCQGGLYVKELVTGDSGRTEPSISRTLKNKAEPMELDVLNVFIKS